MKKYIITFLVFTFILGVSYAQETEKVSVDEYAKYLQKIKNEYVTQNKISEINLNEAKKMAYLAYHTNPIAVKQLMWNEWNEIREKCPKGDTKAYEKLQMERKYLAEKYIRGLLVEELVSHNDTLQYNLTWHTDLMIRGKVIKREMIMHNPTDGSALPSIPLVYLKIQVEDVLVGNALINNDKSNIIEVFFNLRITTRDPWKTNQTYLFNLSYERGHESVSRILTYGDDGFFPIRNGILTDKTNFFGFGENIEWSNFKKGINTIINNIVK